MTRLLLALAALAATAAFADSDQQLLSDSDKAEIRRIVPGADLSHLTLAQAGALATALHASGDHHRQTAIGGEIRAILN